MTIRIQVDVAPLTKRLTDLEQKQLPFALANAVSLVATGKVRGMSMAGSVQERERARLASAFTLRRPEFILREGVKVLDGFATKARPSITLGPSARADFLDKFEAGGVKRPISGRSLAVPVDVKRNKRDIVTRANRPRALLAKTGKFFIVRPGDASPRARHLAPGIYQRLGHGGRANVRLLYALTPEVHVDARLHFVDTATAAVRARWGEAFALAMADAIRTAK